MILNLVLWLFLFSSLSIGAPEPSPRPTPKPDAQPQQLTNNAPFQGALFIYNANCPGSGNECYQNYGGSSGFCPASSPNNCGTIGQPRWCCPNGYDCAAPPNTNQFIGCCLSGTRCNGQLNAADITTITVTATVGTPTVFTLKTTNFPPAQPTFCFTDTLTMVGPGLPATKTGVHVAPGCPPYVVVGKAGRTSVRYRVLPVVLVIHLVLSGVFKMF